MKKMSHQMLNLTLLAVCVTIWCIGGVLMLYNIGAFHVQKPASLADESLIYQGTYVDLFAHNQQSTSFAEGGVQITRIDSRTDLPAEPTITAYVWNCEEGEPNAQDQNEDTPSVIHFTNNVVDGAYPGAD